MTASARSPVQTDERLPVLAAVISPPVVSLAFEFNRTSRGRWSTRWVVDRAFVGDENVDWLERRGGIIDVTGLSPEQAAAALRDGGCEGIVCFAESTLVRTAEIAEQAGFRFMTVQAAAVLANKLTQRQALAAAGIPGPAFVAGSLDVDEQWLDQVVAEVGFPAVAKPQEGSGSRNTFLIESRDQLRKACAVLSEEPDGYIVESCLADSWARADRPYADYVSVESVIADGVVTHVAVSGRPPLAPPFRETGSFTPSNLDDEVQVRLRELATDSLRAVGATVGVFHTEIKLTPDGLRIIEINGRPGGHLSELLGLIGRPSLWLLHGLVGLGLPIEEELSRSADGVGFLYTRQAPAEANVLVRVNGLDEVKNLAGMASVTPTCQVGERIDWHRGSNSMVFYCTGRADDHDDLWRTWEQVDDLVELGWE